MFSHSFAEGFHDVRINTKTVIKLLLNISETDLKFNEVFEVFLGAMHIILFCKLLALFLPLVQMVKNIWSGELLPISIAKKNWY